MPFSFLNDGAKRSSTPQGNANQPNQRTAGRPGRAINLTTGWMETTLALLSLLNGGTNADRSANLLEGNGVRRCGRNGRRILRPLESKSGNARAEDIAHHRNPKHLPLLRRGLRGGDSHPRRQIEECD